MKKLCFGVIAASVGFISIFTGCSNLNIKNENTDIVFNGGAVVAVDNHLLFANGFVKDVENFNSNNKDDYNLAKEYTYLSVLENQNGTKYNSPDDVKQLAETLAGYSCSYLFIHDEYLYFTTPNTSKTSENLHVWKYVTLSRVKINGGKIEKLFTTKSMNLEKFEIKALNFNNNSYIVIYDGVNINCIKLGNKINTTLISSDATSIALPDENQNFNGEIYYSENKNSSFNQSGNIVKKFNLSNCNSAKIFEQNNITINFTGRVNDLVFYTKTQEDLSISKTMILDTENEADFLNNTNQFYSSSISNVRGIAQNSTLHKGIVFESNGYVLYHNLFEDNGFEILVNNDESYVDCITTNNGEFFYTTANGIYSRSVLTDGSVDGEFITNTIVEDMMLQSGVYGYDFNLNGNLNNLYFYAQQEHEPDENESESLETEVENEEKYYLYSVRTTGEKEVKLVSKTL